MNKQASFLSRSHNPDVLSCIANLSNDEVFTPPSLVNRMLDDLEQAWAESSSGESIWSNPSVTFLDPCTKSGVFLREIVQRLVAGQEGYEEDLSVRVDRILGTQVFGIGITNLTALLARRSVYCSKFADGAHSIFKSAGSSAGNIWFEQTEHEWGLLRCVACGASRSEYEREEGLESHAYRFIHGDRSKSAISGLFGGNMEFDVVVGNPPYQLSDSGYGSSARPIYQNFVEQAKALDPRFIAMITPSRWFAGGKGLDEFRAEMLSDRRMVSINDFPNSRDVFDGVDVAGGVSYFLWSKDHADECSVNTWVGADLVDTMVRPLDEFEVFVRNNRSVELIRKVRDVEGSGFRPLSQLVSARKPFGLDTTFDGEDTSDHLKEPVRVRGRSGISFIERSLIPKNMEWVDKWKVMTSMAASEHGGQAAKDGTRKVLSRLEVLEPGTICTETYLICFTSDSEKDAKSMQDYLATKFARYLLYCAMITQHITRGSFMFVPEVDLDELVTDEALYAHYGLSDELIIEIETAIRLMGGEHGA